VTRYRLAVATQGKGGWVTRYRLTVATQDMGGWVTRLRLAVATQGTGRLVTRFRPGNRTIFNNFLLRGHISYGRRPASEYYNIG